MGTRLREETERVPKPLVEIGERPILWHIMKLYGHHGARRFLALPRLQELGDQGVLPALPRARARTYRPRRQRGAADVPRQCGRRGLGGHARRDGPRAGTGARLRRVRRYVDTRHVHVHLRRRHRRRRHRGAARVPPLPRPHRHRDRRAAPARATARCASTASGSTEFNEKPTTPRASSAAASSSSSARSSTT